MFYVASFHVSVNHLYVFLGKISPAHFLNALFGVLFPIEFYDFLIYSTILQVIFSFHCFCCYAELFYIDAVPFILPLLLVLLVSYPDNHCRDQCLGSSSPSSFTRSIDSGLIFKFLINFELILVGGTRLGTNSILLHVNIQFAQHHLSIGSILYPLSTLGFLAKY